MDPKNRFIFYDHFLDSIDDDVYAAVMEKVNLVCLFGQRKNEDNPELMVAWDEFCIDLNPKGFETACESAVSAMGTDLIDTRIVNIQINMEDIRELFATANIQGKILK